MPFKYDNLWKILENKNMSKDELRFKIRSSQTTIVKMGKNENVSLDVIDRICDTLKCTPNDIMEFIPFDQKTYIPIIRKKGDIFLYEFGFGRNNDLDNGEILPSSSHLCLLFQNENYIDSSHAAIIIPFSSQMSVIPIPTDIVIEPDEQNNFENPYVLKVSEFRRISRGMLRVKCGQLSEKDMERVNKACADFLGL